MSKKNVNKRPSSVIGIKSMLAGAAVVTTIAGWAILPQNDPQYAVADAQAADLPGAIASVEPTMPTATLATPTAIASKIAPTVQALLPQPSKTPVSSTDIQVAPSATTQPTAEPTATVEPTAKPTEKPIAITRTRSSK